MTGYEIIGIVMLSKSALPLFVRIYNDDPTAGGVFLSQPLVISGFVQSFNSYSRILKSAHFLEAGKTLREIWFDDNILLVVRGTVYDTVCSARIDDLQSLSALRAHAKRLNDAFAHEYAETADQIHRDIEVFREFRSVCDGLIIGSGRQ